MHLESISTSQVIFMINVMVVLVAVAVLKSSHFVFTGHFSAAEVAASLLKRRQQTLSLSNNSSDNIGQSESNMDEADNAVSTPLASQRLLL